MLVENINVWAVLASAVASMVIGSVWYGPLFGKIFMKTSGLDKLSKKQQDEMKRKMKVTFLLQFIASLVTFITIAWLLSALNRTSLGGAIAVSLIAWAGIIVPVKLGEQLWGGKMLLFWLGAGETFVTMLAAGVILGLWR